MKKYHFPLEIIQKICLNLEIESLSSVSLINKDWNIISKPMLYTCPRFKSCKQFINFLKCIEEQDLSFNNHDNNGCNVARLLVNKIDLSNLGMRWNEIHDGYIIRLINCCPNINNLNLSLCRIHDNTLEAITSTYGKQLTRLGLEGIRTLYAFEYISQHCTNLIELDLAETNINDQQIEAILKVNKNTLKEISLENCEAISDIGIRLLYEMPQMKFINLNGCYGILKPIPLGEWEEENVEWLEN